MINNHLAFSVGSHDHLIRKAFLSFFLHARFLQCTQCFTAYCTAAENYMAVKCIAYGSMGEVGGMGGVISHT